MALAFLTKGLIGIIFPVGLVIAVGTYESYMDRCWRPLRQWLIWMLSPKAIVLFILISAPWFILMHLQHPDFLHVFFIQEHFQRFTSTVHNRVEPMVLLNFLSYFWGAYLGVYGSFLLSSMAYVKYSYQYYIDPQSKNT